MKFICEGLDLSEALLKVSKACASKTTVAVLECVKVSAYNDVLTLLASDGELSIEKKIKADVLEEGEVCVPGKTFTDFINKLVGTSVSLQTKDSGLEITYGENTTSLQVLPADDFPAIDMNISENNFSIGKKVFKDVIARTVFCCAQDDSRPILKGCLWEIENGELVVTALDGFRMAVVQEKTVSSSALFTVAPALAILATVLTLSGALGLVLPWIRLTVIGAITYEVPAAEAAIDAFGSAAGLSQEVTDPEMFSTVAWVMTLGSIMPLILVPFLLKKIQKGMSKAVAKNGKWADVMSAAAFIGLIAAFIGRAIAGKGEESIIGDGAGVMSLCALVSSMIFMLILQSIANRFNIKWLQPFAMPFSMLLAMGVVMLLAQVLPPDIALFEWRG